MSDQDQPKKEEIIELAETLESGYMMQISALNDIALGIAILLRREAEKL